MISAVIICVAATPSPTFAPTVSSDGGGRNSMFSDDSGKVIKKRTVYLFSFFGVFAFCCALAACKASRESRRRRDASIELAPVSNTDSPLAAPSDDPVRAYDEASPMARATSNNSLGDLATELEFADAEDRRRVTRSPAHPDGRQSPRWRSRFGTHSHVL